MGFRFRKSIKCGPFRLNLSKKGIGWSAGVPGFRFTQKAGGGHRTTASIPGTGLSYVKESGSSSRKKSAGRKLNTSSAVPSSVPVSSGPAGAPGPNGPRKPRSAFGVPEILASAFGCFMVLVFLITAATGCQDSTAASSQSSSVPESAIVAAAPMSEPSAAPTVEPTAEPTPEPTAEPTPEPTAEPTPAPTAAPTEAPAPQPAAAEPQGQMVWIASSGKGKKYHSDPTCSNMNNPLEISISDAQAKGYEPCKNCY